MHIADFSSFPDFIKAKCLSADILILENKTPENKIEILKKMDLIKDAENYKITLPKSIQIELENYIEPKFGSGI